MVGGALERGGKEGHDRLLILNQPTICFLKKTEFPPPTPLQTTFLALCLGVCSFLVSAFWRWWCTAVQYLAN